MAEDKETRAGLISGIVAAILVVALSVMAMNGLAPTGARGAQHLAGSSDVSRLAIGPSIPR